MAGAVVMVAVLVLVIPVAVAMGGAVVAALLGHFLTQNGETVNEGSELIALNR